MAITNLVLDNNWQFKESSATDWLPAQVPGCVHTDLIKNEQISDPFYGKNELDHQWIDKKDWEYKTNFTVSDELLTESNIEIIFDGLDTYAEVYLNEQHILSANNMFRTWKADVKPILKRQNTLHVYFRSPIHEDLVKLEKLDYQLPANNDHSEDGGLGDKKVSVFARKAPYHYGWDWGPRFVTSGIWKEVRLEGWSDLCISDVFIHQKEITKERAELTAIIQIDSDHDWEGQIQLSSEDLQFNKNVKLQSGENTVKIDCTIRNPKLWWSRGLGKQYLYTFTAEVLANDGHVITKKAIRTGLRSIRLVREKDDKGTSFFFEINGVPVFAKGANHIPNDSFITEVTYERYRHEIETAVKSNMNMLRVWGGGIYEYDAFYELCDEYGILVWQDFMFACSMYPGDKAFLENIKIEAEDNIKRLRNHPSIVLWCGNNEMDSAWAHYDEDLGWGWKQSYSSEIREKIWADYEAIFHEILPEAVKTYTLGAEYWPSSPMNDLSGTASQHATSETTSGDVHFWGVWHELMPLEDYKRFIGRFMSEYGFQSFPELKTVQTYAEEKDMSLESDVMLHHQKNSSGNRIIKEYMENYYKQPKDFPSFLYLSQVLQADAIESAIEAHRMKKPYCMGSLYWQMNDCWPVASWSSMDYYGRWKALQYVAKRSYRDVMLAFDQSDNTLDVHIISDILAEISGTLSIMLYDLNGKVLRNQAKEIRVEANSAKVVETIQKNEWF